MEIPLSQIKELAHLAGKQILEIYNSGDFATIQKQDNSPLTRADKAAHKLIVSGLKKIAPDIPIISEEGEEIPLLERQQWDTFWLVDPLDGTKEFINKNGEFTVNIALIKARKPIMGVVYAPVLDIFYYAKQGEGAYKQAGQEQTKLLECTQIPETLIAARSKSHAHQEEEIFLADYNIAKTISVGSSLKFCLVAEKKAHIYYRHGPTCEWDTAAGHAVVLYSGGKVLHNGKELLYNKENLRNGSFACFCHKEITKRK